MPLGASRVAGFHPYFESFRYELWKDLIDGNWRVDFVGTQTDDADYETYKTYCFDNNHEGRSGWTSSQINSGIELWLSQTETPDIVLFSSPGGNDALQGASVEEILPNINAIIDKIQAHNPNITILIEQLAPGHSSIMTGDLKIAFDEMMLHIAQIAQDHTTQTSQVIAVDMSTGFLDDFLADGVHYNLKGAQFIAERYYNALIPYLE